MKDVLITIKTNQIYHDGTKDGMEFSTEMIAEAKRKNLHLAEVPVWFGRSRCDRDSKLHPFSDGLRHLVYMWKG